MPRHTDPRVGSDLVVGSTITTRIDAVFEWIESVVFQKSIDGLDWQAVTVDGKVCQSFVKLLSVRGFDAHGRGCVRTGGLYQAPDESSRWLL